MFPRIHTLPLRSYKDFFDEAQKLKSGPFSVFMRTAPTTRLVVLVPKRVSALATARHRMKRAVYAELVSRLEKLAELQVHLVVVVQRPLDLTRLSPAIEKLLQDVSHELSSVQ